MAAEDLYVAINGVQYAFARLDATKSIDYGSLSIIDTLHESPNTCAFRARGFNPVEGQDVVITLATSGNTDRLFAGTILNRSHEYVGTPANWSEPINVIDYTWGLTRRRCSLQYTATSASTIGAAIVALAPGYTSGIVGGLPTLDTFSCTDVTLLEALTQLAKRIGGYCDVDYHKVIKLFITDATVTNPTALTSAHATLTAFAFTRDLSQVRTRILYEGGGSTALTDVAVGATSLTVSNAAWYNPAGGTVKSGSQHLTYTGVVPGIAVVARPAPTGAPTAAVLSNAGAAADEMGSWSAVFTYVYGTIESEASPVSNVITLVGALDAISLTNVSVGPSGCTKRWIYLKKPSTTTWRGNAGQAELRFAILNNTATTASFSAQTAGSTLTPPVSPTPYAAGSTYVFVADTAAFSASGGSARSGAQIFTYTGRSTSSGVGALTGIPASGPGALLSAIAIGDLIAPGVNAANSLSGIPASGAGSILYPILQGDQVNVLAIVDDAAAQTALAALIGGGDDGVVEDFYQDGTIGETEAIARATAYLALKSTVAVSITYQTRDPNCRAGRTQSVNLGAPTNVVADFQIQHVTIDRFNPKLLPTFTAQASSDRFSLEDLLRMVRKAA